MAIKRSIPNPEDPTLFASPEPLTAEEFDMGAMATRIALNAQNNPVDTNKPLSPVMEDMGWQRRETLAVDPPRQPFNRGRAHPSRSDISKAAIGPRRGEEEGVGYPNGEPFYYQHPDPLTSEEKLLNARGRAAVSAAAKASHREQQA